MCSRVNPRCKKKNTLLLSPSALFQSRRFQAAFAASFFLRICLCTQGGGVISSTGSTLNREKRSVTARCSLPLQRLSAEWCLTVSLSSPDSAPPPLTSTCAARCDKILSVSFQLIIVRSAAEFSAVILKKTRGGGLHVGEERGFFPLYVSLSLRRSGGGLELLSVGCGIRASSAHIQRGIKPPRCYLM